MIFQLFINFAAASPNHPAVRLRRQSLESVAHPFSAPQSLRHRPGRHHSHRRSARAALIIQPCCFGRIITASACIADFVLLAQISIA